MYVDYIHLAQNRFQWRVLVTTEIKPSGCIENVEFLE